MANRRPPASIGNPHGYPDWTWPMIWVLQEGELWPIEQWVAKTGDFKHWEGCHGVGSGATVDIDLYTVPAGKVVHLSRLVFSPKAQTYNVLYYGTPNVAIIGLNMSAFQPFLAQLAPPWTVAAGKTIKMQFYNFEASATTVCYFLSGYELDA